MPQSLILKLTAQSAIAPKYQQGYALQRLFFELIKTVDPRLGQVLQCDSTNRSYSFSTLQHTAEHLQYSAGGTIPARAQCWWRIAFLDDLLFDSVAGLWQSLRGERFDLGTAHLTIDEVIVKTPTTGRIKASTAMATTCS